MIRPRFALLLAPLLGLSTPSHAGQLELVGDTMTLGSKPGNPTYDLPANQRLLSPFGERPAFSPDGKKLAFIGKSYGDAFELDIATGKIRNLTSHTPHEGFLRVQYLHDGSLLLAGPHILAATRAQTRAGAIELFWLDPAGSRALVPLKVTVFEGIATSLRSNRIAWAEIAPHGASFMSAKSATLKTADVVVSGGSARLANVQDIVTTTDCLIEAQDFLPGDTGLTMPCYHFGAKPPVPLAEVLSVDFATRKISRYPTPPTLYNEIEGIFPDGKRTLVECAGDRAVGMDICILDLKTDTPRYTRLTRIMDYGRWKYGNPVVSPDGRTIAAQVGSADVIDAGVGQGIVLIDVPRDM